MIYAKSQSLPSFQRRKKSMGNRKTINRVNHGELVKPRKPRKPRKPMASRHQHRYAVRKAEKGD